MNWLFWTGGLLLFGVAAFSVYIAFRSPKFIAGLTAIASSAAWKALKPIVVKQRTPEQQAQDRAEYRAGRGDEYWRRRNGGPPKG